ncbi:MAG TPA: DoxX family protein [Gemmatimonadales bacterium]|nr:DoxX family protein [Gemmatimonadales bacterium]
MRKLDWKDLLLWVPTLFLVYVFARQGPAKFSDTSGWAQAFAHWHYPSWFRILVGAVETSAAGLLLIRRTASIGAAMIAIVMLGGMATHVYWGRPQQVTSEVLPLTLALILLWGRRRHVAQLQSAFREHPVA